MPTMADFSGRKQRNPVQRISRAYVKKHNALNLIYQQKLVALDALKKSLLDQAFRGEL